MSKLIVIEGLDGSGKSTQLGLLRHYLSKNNIDYKYIHFPRLEEGVYGDMVARFLRGELGSLEQVDPYLVALLYAGDRFDASKEIASWLQDGKLVVFDRYVHSNIAYQCAKLNDVDAIRKLNDWIYHLEFSYFNIPQPDLSVFLHVPISFVQSRLEASRSGDDRTYLKGQQDIHESSMDFQSRVEQEYLRIASEDKKYKVLNCIDDTGNMYTAEAIHHNLIDLFKSEGCL